MRVAKRKRYEASFKAKVALEALKERKTASLFERGSSEAVLEAGPPSSELYEQIGRLKVEVAFLKKSSSAR